MIGERTAEEINSQLVLLLHWIPVKSLWMLGRDATAGLQDYSYNFSEIREEALKEVVGQIVDLVKNALDRCQPEHSADLIDHGIVLAIGALIRGLDQVISDATGLRLFKPMILLLRSKRDRNFLTCLGHLAENKLTDWLLSELKS